jgi:hypothetical protein
LAVLMGAVVFATFQVTVCPDPAAQLTAVFGAVTAKGPAALFTVGLFPVNGFGPRKAA